MSKRPIPKGILNPAGIIALIIWAVFVVLAYSQQYSGHFHQIKSVFTNPVFYSFVGVLLLAWGFERYRIKKPLALLSSRLFYLVAFPVFLVIFLYKIGTANELSTYLSLDGFGSAFWKAFRSIAFLAVVVAGASLSGKLATRKVSIPAFFRPSVEIATGLMLLVLAMFLVGAFDTLNMVSSWILVMLPFALNYKDVPGLAREIFKQGKDQPALGFVGVLSATFITAVLALNFLATLIPFPLGWDSLNLYVNLASLVNDHNGLVPGQQGYNWSLLMSLGYLMLDKGSLVLALSFLGGPLSLMAVYGLSRKWLERDYALLAAAILYSLPVVTFQSVKDFKIDLGLLFVGLVVIMLLVSWFSNTNKSSFKQAIDNFRIGSSASWQNFIAGNNTLLLAGLLTGFAFGIKYTSVFIAFSFLIGLGFLMNGFLGFVSMTSLVIFLIFQFHLDTMSGLRFFHIGIGYIKWTLMGLFLLISVILYLRQRLELRRTIICSVFYLAALFLTFSPWVTKNIVEASALSPSTILFGSKPLIEQEIMNDLEERAPIDKGKLPTGFDQFKQKPDPTILGESAKVEEIQRFMGYEPGPVRYLSLPIDVSMGLNVPGNFAAIGFLFLFCMPLLLVRIFRGKTAKQLITTLLWVVAIGLAFWGAAVSSGVELSGQPHEVAGNFFPLEGNEIFLPILQFLTVIFLLIASPVKTFFLADVIWWYFFTYPLIFVLFGILIWSFRSFMKKRKRSESAMIILFLAYSFLWMILSGGIVWYGFHMLAMGGVAIAYYFYRLNMDESSRHLYYPVFIVVILWFLFSLSDRITALSPEETAVSEQLLPKPHVGYLFGQYNDESLLDRVQPLYAYLARKINEDEDSRVYRVGTFLPFFIEKNKERVFTDNQLDIFKRLLEAYDDKEALAARLSDAGFKYLVIDLNTHTIDQTPEKTLTQKYIDFMRFVQQNPRLQLIRTDRRVSDPFREEGPDNQPFEGVFGRIEESGTIAVYKIQ